MQGEPRWPSASTLSVQASLFLWQHGLLRRRLQISIPVRKCQMDRHCCWGIKNLMTTGGLRLSIVEQLFFAAWCLHKRDSCCLAVSVRPSGWWDMWSLFWLSIPNSGWSNILQAGLMHVAEFIHSTCTRNANANAVDSSLARGVGVEWWLPSCRLTPALPKLVNFFLY